MSRAQKSILHLASSLGLNAVTILVSFFSIPIILNALGDVKFGLSRTIFEWLGLYSVISVAYLSASSQILARQKGSKEELSTLFQSYFIFGIKILLYISPIALFFIILSPYIVGASPELFKDARWASFLGNLGLVFIPCLVFQAFLDADNRSYVVNSAMLVQRLIVTFLSIATAILLKSIAGQLLALLAGQIIFFGLIIYKSELRIKYWGEKKWKFNLKEQGYWQGMLPFMMIDAAGKLGMSADTILISLLLGPAEVTKFYLWVRIPTMILGQLVSLGNAIWAGFTQVFNEGGDTRSLFLRTSKIVSLLSSACGGTIFLFNSDVLEVWLGRGFALPVAFNILVAFNIYTISLIAFFGWILTAIRNEVEFSRASLVSSSINVFVSFLATLKFGLLGPVIGSFIGYGIVKTSWLMRLLKIKINLTVWDLMQVTLFPILLSAFYFYLIGQLREPWGLLQMNWLRLIISGLIANIFYLFLGWLILLNRSEKTYWTLRFKNIIRRTS